jgi:parvulin-like peptidyl-prolyl isomerase
MDTVILRKLAIVVTLLIGLVVPSACGSKLPQPGTANPDVTSTNEPSETVEERTPIPVKPTATPVPLAALVNGEPITVEELQAELSQYASAQAQSGMNLATDAERLVLDNVINQVLLAQAAYETGNYSDPNDLQVRMDELAEKVGGPQALADWYTEYGFSEPGFRIALARAIAAAWMRDQIITEVPATAEQVHARQILLYNEEDAARVYDLLQSGQDFESLANSYDPITHGDLGWFPRGYLTQAMVDQAAFSLEPEEYSQVIQSDIGYHIVQVIEKDPQRPLDPESYADLQIQKLQEWLDERRAMSEIQILLP